MRSGRVATVVCDWSGQRSPSWGLLTVRERALLRSLPRWRQRETLLGRLAGHAAVLLADGVPCHGVEILKDERGAPHAVMGDGRAAGPRVSIAHTGDVVAATAAFPDAPLGVDVEYGFTDGTHPLPRHRSSPLDPTLVFSCQEAAVKAHRDTILRLTCYPVSRRKGELWVDTPQPPGPLRAWPHPFRDHVVVTVTPAGTRPTVYWLPPERLLALLAEARRTPTPRIPFHP